MRSLFSFPNPVNEYAARVVAGGVVLMAMVAIAFQQQWVMLIIASGFLARVAAGPRFSVLGRLAVHVVAPRLSASPKLVPGPPKRFAQGVGVAFSLSAVLLAYVFDAEAASYVVLGLLAVAASLEALFGLCLGCKAFAGLMRVGLIPESVCEACNNVSLRNPA